MIWVAVGLLVLFNGLLLANYVQAGRLVRRISMQNTMMSYILFPVGEEEDEPHLKIVEDQPTE